MRLSVGDKLGPYEILAPIGRGGMGEVFRACDTRLGREVAVKVSAEKFSDRFEREARAVSNRAGPCPTTRNGRQSAAPTPERLPIMML
jgi:serine/threonine protein kinase